MERGVSVNPDIKQAWLAALRSGEYQQGQRALHTTDGRFCCLGVLCDLHAKAGGADWGAIWNGSRSYVDRFDELPYEVQEWAELETGNPRVNGVWLSVYNDGSGEGDEPIRPHTFAEIADLIEAHL
jgi:hypothetical protein